ncbi:hypothetical protein [Sinorhizobium medicae]|uniref:hypothetical protein n=1 Tax=Sinorhizobium medicae TaxID=110321 RepID=UPI001647CED4|nr:hypothetical protein [Sinorhizobium medicae]
MECFDVRRAIETGYCHNLNDGLADDLTRFLEITCKVMPLRRQGLVAGIRPIIGDALLLER